MPIGTDVNVSDSMIMVIEGKVYEVLKPDMDIVKSILTVAGKGAVSENDGFTARGGAPNRGIITINFIDFNQLFF